METIILRLIGTAPLLLNNARLANPFDPFTKRLRVAVERMKKDKTEEMMLEAARIEWEGSLYMDDKLGPVLPAINVERSIVEGARMTKSGKKLERGVQATSPMLKIEYKGPRDPDGMWVDGSFVDQRSCGVQGRRVTRTRPIFRDWTAQVTLAYDPAQVDRETIVRSAIDAGARVGIGNFRPNCGGHFGTFDVQEVA